jgi:DNA processing protein
MQQERAYWLAWSQIPGVGPILLDRVCRHFGSPIAAWAASREALLGVEGWGMQLVSKVVEIRAKIDPEALLEGHLVKNPNWWIPSDVDYPRLLLEIPSAPPILYYRGQVQLGENQGLAPTIGMVGTRYPSDYGKKWTRKISSLLASKGFTIISGMAQGIDAEAHSACLEVGGRTIAVVGTGVDRVYPPRNQGLHAQIEARGLIVSEYSAGTAPDRAHFPARNRIIAGWSRAVIVMEAPVKSGALITAYQANDFGRDVYVLLGDIDREQTIGCYSLLDRGAIPFYSAEHLLELLSDLPQIDPPQQLQLFDSFPTRSVPTVPRDLSPELQKIWKLMTVEPRSFDAIVTGSNLPPSEVSSGLLQLELLGLVTQLPGMRYQILTVDS